MAKVTITVEMTDRQDQALTRLLERTNARLAPRRETPHADVTALLTEMLTDLVQNAVQQHCNEQKTLLADAVDSATAEQLETAAKALGVTLP